MNKDRYYLQDDSPCELLHKFIEIFNHKGWLDKELKIKCQNNIYKVSCNKERFFAYQINENCGLGSGMPGWPVCIIRQDYVYDESLIPNLTSTSLNKHDWLNIIAANIFELI
jgi:hypothetical protein